MLNYYTIPQEILRKFTEQVFVQTGHSATDAAKATDVLISADLRGIDSHGVARLTGYVRLTKAGRVNPAPVFSTKRETLSTLTLDADSGLGLLSGPFAMKEAIKKAEHCGTGWAAVENSNHFGIAAYHTLMAVEKGMIGIAMTNASPLVTPARGKERMLGTNPICIAFPAKKFPPFVLDMATSSASNGKLEIAERKQKEVPTGWLLNNQGENSNNASELKKGGMLLTLGSDEDHGHYKGYGLSAAVDLFCGVLSGANYGPWVPPFVSFLPLAANMPGKGIGHFFGAMRVDAFREAEDYYKNIDQWIGRFKETIAIDPSKPVLIPGEPEFEMEKIRKVSGIPLIENVWNDLQEIAKDLGISPLEI